MNERGIVRLVITCEDSQGLESTICQHFGHSPAFAVVEAEGTDIRACQVVENPMANGHVPGALPDFIAGLDADVVITGGMGQRAIARFQEHGITVVAHPGGTVREAVEQFLAGGLGDVAPCRDHGHAHGHGHGCGH
jgi:predicted Fe-Mo cluster-binding NifX family protein